MAKNYSLDLRLKVLEFLSQDHSKRETAKVFNIGEDTVYRWIRLQKNGSDLRPKKQIFLPKKVDPKKLQEYVEINPDHTLKEIGTALGYSGYTVWNWLGRMKITRKKKRHFMQKVVPKNVLNFK